MLIKWSKEYSVNVKEIDEEHKKFVSIINELNNAINKHETKTKVKKIVGDLVAYAKFHFSTEEKYFKKFNYEGTAEHVAEHNNFRTKVAKMLETHEGKEIEVAFEIIDFLEDWFIDHVTDIDKKYTKCFNENGLF